MTEKNNQDLFSDAGDESPDNESKTPYDGPQKEEVAGKKKSSMPFLDHIEELRWRIIKALVTVIVFAIIGFAFSEQVFIFFQRPLGGDVELYFTEITGSFYAYLKISFFTGIFAGLPVIFYQLWKFIGPGLYSSERKMVIPLVFASTALFLVGASFCFYIVMPLALTFLIGYGGEAMTPLITVSSYISFAGLLLVAFGTAFQIPVIAYFLGRIGVINPQIMGKARAYAVVVFLVGAAVMSPPDVFTQVLLAGPLYLLYEISIIIVRITQRGKTKTEDDQE